MDLFDRLLAAEAEVFAYFGYNPTQIRYLERHPILDHRNDHWLLVKQDSRVLVCWSPEPFTGQNLESGNTMYAEGVLDWLSKSGGVFRGPHFSLIAIGFPNDGPRRYLLFSNNKECQNQFLAALATEQPLA